MPNKPSNNFAPLFIHFVQSLTPFVPELNPLPVNIRRRRRRFENFLSRATLLLLVVFSCHSTPAKQSFLLLLLRPCGHGSRRVCAFPDSTAQLVCPPRSSVDIKTWPICHFSMSTIIIPNRHISLPLLLCISTFAPLVPCQFPSFIFHHTFQY